MATKPRAPRGRKAKPAEETEQKTEEPAEKPKRKPGRPRGRPPYKPSAEDRAVVQAMTAAGQKVSVIAWYLRISETSARKHFSDEIERGLMRANLQVTTNLWQIASGKHKKATAADQVRAAIHWLKKRDPEHWGDDLLPEQPPVDPSDHRDLTRLSDQQLREIRALGPPQ